MSMAGGNPSIEISVTARIDELEQGLKAAQAKVDGTVVPMGQAGERAGDAFAKKFGAVMKAAGIFAAVRAFTRAGEAASEAFAQGASAPDIARTFMEDLQQTLFNIPIAGDVAKIFDNLLNGAERAAAAAAEKYASEFQDQTARMLDTSMANNKILKGLKRGLALNEEEMTLGATDEGKIEIARREKIRDLNERIEEVQEEQRKKIADFSLKGQTEADERARKAALEGLNRQFDAQVSLLQAQKRQAEQKAEQDTKALADGKALEAQTKAQAAATKAAEEAAKAKRDADIKALEQTGKAREDAIAAQIAALQGQSPAARAASIGALTQQFAGNMGGDIQTALGTFRGGGAALAERAFQEAQAQTEKQEKIVKLQEEMKRLHEDTNRKIDAMKGAA